MEETTIKRPLIIAAGGFVLGEVLALLKVGWFAVPAGCLAGMGFLAARRGRSAVTWLLLFFGISGFVRTECVIRGAERQLKLNLDGRTASVNGAVREIREKEGDYTVVLEHCMLERGEEKAIPMGRVPISADEETARWIEGGGVKIGMGIRATGRLKAHAPPRNPGEFDYRNYYRAMGSDYKMYADRAELADLSYSPLLDLMYRVRLGGCLALDRISDPGDAGIFKAVLFGEKGELGGDVRDLYQRNGIAHLLAISGLHISLVGMGLYRILRKAGLSYGAAGLAGGCLLLCYGLVAGSPASAVRAIAMLCCAFLADWLGRTYDLLSAAALAMLMILADSPYQLTQGGFQLSFGAVMAIGGPGKILLAELKPTKGWQKGIVVSMSIQLVTYPIILYHFFQYPIYGILLNLIVIPLMSYVVLSGLAGLSLGVFSCRAGAAAVGTGHYILAFYQWLCELFERLPCANLVLGRPGWAQLIIYYVFLAFALTGFGRMRESLTGGEESGRLRPAVRWGYSCVFFVVCFFLLFPLPVRGLKVVFLDVGQGDGIVLMTGRSAVLVDGGSSSEKKLGEFRLEPFLKSSGISHVSCAIVSHGDNDHVSGLLYLLEESRDIQIDRLVLPLLGREEEIQGKLAGLARAKGGRVSEMSAGDEITLGDLRLTCLYPGEMDEAADRNEQSLVIKVDYGSFHLLLTGDMSEAGEAKILCSSKRACLCDIQVLKTAHHGSRSASSQEFLEQMPLKWAVVSYGEGNSYGHPHREVTERLTRKGADLWETAMDGAVTVTTDGERVSWEGFCPRPDLTKKRR